MKNRFSHFISLRLLVLLAGLLPSFALSAAGGSITTLGRLNGGNSTQAFAMTPDGTVIVGGADDGANGNTFTAFRTQSSGLVGLGQLNGGNFSEAADINRNGTVIVGDAVDGASAFLIDTAFIWTQPTGIVSLGLLNGSTGGSAFSFSNAVNADGTVVVGQSTDGSNGNLATAFRWTQATRMVSLGMLNGGDLSTANDVNADGSVVVGFADDGSNANAPTAFRWTQATGMMPLGFLNGGHVSHGNAISDDGNVIAGFANDGTNGNLPTAFRWTQATGIVSLGMLNGGNLSKSFDISPDGIVIVGTASDGAAGNIQRGFRWTQATGLQKIEDWLRANGVTVPTDMTLNAVGVSSDGTIVSGELTGRKDAYIARVLPSPSPIPNGLISLSNLSQSILSVAQTPNVTINILNMLMHGSHGYPLIGALPENRHSNVWVAGDWGKLTNHATGGLAEVGVSHRLCSWLQDSIGFGLTRDGADLDLGGHSHFEGAYGLAEVMAHYRCLFATATAFYHWGDIDIRRGYLNAGMPDSSKGKPRTETFAFRFRLDWKDMLEWKRLSFSPYGEVSTINARIKSYSESGGSFPSMFNARKPKATDARIGLRAYFQAACNTRLFATAEGVFNLKENNPHTSGQLIGLFAFDLSGTSRPRSWARGGLGLEHKIGEGVASIAVNGTTKGQDPRYWLAASYYLSF